jgi:hypothetical protein
MSIKPHFLRGATSDHHHSSASPPPPSGNPNLTTSLHHTQFGLFALTWSRTLFGRSLHLHHLSDDSLPPPPLSTPSFSLNLKHLLFWNKSGSKNLNFSTPRPASIFWDLSKARFGSGSGPEPKSHFYIAVVVDGEIALLVGDLMDEAYAKTRAPKSSDRRRIGQTLVLRREHVYGNKLYSTKADFCGKTRNMSIDCRLGNDPRLCFSIDSKRVLQIKHLKWKFRGNERIEVDGIEIQISWDVHNWLFEDEEDGYALFMFRFEKLGFLGGDCLNQWSHERNSYGFGFETKKMKKRIMRSARSSSAASSSLSSASSSCSSVMEWASVEENELKGPSGFCLMVYAWKG